VRFLGNIINEKGIAIDQSRVKCFPEWKKPNTKRKIQKILGTINWYRPYIPNLSIKLDPIYSKLQSKNKSYELNETELKVIKNIYEEIRNAPLLAHPDINEKFTLHSDASDIGVGCVHTQKEQVVGHFSYKFNHAERNYTTMEKELFAIVMGLKHFRNLILGCDIEVITDNKNLTYSKLKPNARASRWFNLLNEFRISFKHVKGIKNNAADYISREHLNITTL
jgi:hypothetical protein